MNDVPSLIAATAVPPPLPVARPRWSRRALAGFIITALSVSVGLSMALWIVSLAFGEDFDATTERKFSIAFHTFMGSLIFGLVGTNVAGSAISWGRITGTAFRGRGLAVFGTCAWRVLTFGLAVGCSGYAIGELASRDGFDLGPEAGLSRAVWIAGGCLIAVYVLRSIRHARRAAKPGWWRRAARATMSGLGQALSIVVMMASFMWMMQLRMEGKFGNPGQRTDSGWTGGNGLYAMRELDLQLEGDRGRKLSVRLWRNGEASEVMQATVGPGFSRLRWSLMDDGANNLSLKWASGGPVADSPAAPETSKEGRRRRRNRAVDVELASHTFEDSAEATLFPTAGQRQPVDVHLHGSTNVWLFLPLDQINEPSADPKKLPWAVELVIPPG
jgi:hypothetical protein